MDDQQSFSDFFSGKTVLVTGGCGTVGAEIIRQLLAFPVSTIRVFDINEEKLFELQQQYAGEERLRLLLGDIRDKDRLLRALDGVQVVFHAAALKHVYSSEYNPFEAAKTNIVGTQNLIDASLSNEVKHFVFTSTDKAVNPTNVMGTSKLFAEKLVTAANYYSGDTDTIFCSVRFGNVLGSSGSVIPLFRQQIKQGGPVTITNPKMSRFVMHVDQAVRLMLKAAILAKGGEVFVSKMPVMRVGTLAETMIKSFAPLYGFKPEQISTIRIDSKPGEKLYEELMTEDEQLQAYDLGDSYVIVPKASPLFVKNISYPYTTKVISPPTNSYDLPAMTSKELIAFLNKGELCTSPVSVTPKKKKIVASIEARMTSTRLPGKVLYPVLGKPLLELMIERIQRSKLVDDIVIATTINSADDVIVDLAKKLGVRYYRGSEDDVLGRVLEAHKQEKSDIIVELTGDCPLIDPEIIDELITCYLENDFDYVSNGTIKHEVPRGLDVQVFSVDLLQDVANRTDDKDDREHVSLFIYNNPQLYKLFAWTNPYEWLRRPDLRLTVDTPEDFALIKAIFEACYVHNPSFTSKDVIDLLDAKPELAQLNSHVEQKPVRST